MGSRPDFFITGVIDASLKPAGKRPDARERLINYLMQYEATQWEPQRETRACCACYYTLLYTRTCLMFNFFPAVGCSNLIPPEDAWIKREDDKIIIGCYTSRQTWQLRCHDGRWTGVVSNCSKRMFNSSPQSQMTVIAYTLVSSAIYTTTVIISLN